VSRTKKRQTKDNSQFAIRNSQLTKLVPLLLDWFSANARDLPWRRTRDPYAIWISEIMLQQTQVKTVIPYWKRWMRELPTIKAVANASPDKIHKLWEGLGYYVRARNLQKAARQIVEKHDGKFPDDFDDVLALPGVGRYTAGAICSIAFNQPTPILDGNVIRVLTRVFGISQNPREKKTNAQLWQLAEKLVAHASPVTCHLSHPKSRTRTKDEDDSMHPHFALRTSHFNQSVMELGALVCIPRSPDCPACPLKKLCIAFREDRVNELPNLGKRPPSTARHFIAFIVEQHGHFLVRQRPAGVVNAHLWEFPNVEIDPNRSSSGRQSAHYSGKKGQSRLTSAATIPGFDSVIVQATKNLGFEISDAKHLCTVKHSITRYRITLEAWRVKSGGRSSTTPKISGTRGARPSEIGVWLSPAKLDSLALTSAHRKILRRLQHSQ
jgi:A/G-specific adenine glycosylase